MKTLQEKRHYERIWYQKNKEKRLQFLKRRVVCEICEKQYTYVNKSKHIKTKYHISCIE